MGVSVYSIQHRESGRLYIGITSTGVAHRWGQHRADARGKIHRPLANALRKYGPDAFDWTELSVWPDAASAGLEEVRLIAELKPVYNILAGGRGGYTQPESVRAQMRAKALQRGPLPADVREKIAASKRGKTLTPAHCAKLSAAQQNRQPPTAETRAKLSAAQRGNTKNLGKVRSDETRAKLSAAAKRRWADPEQRAALTAAIQQGCNNGRV
jgi:predicted GIY-YIG superfamily endonuclease